MSHDHNHDHEERELITLVDEQGNETLFEILYSFIENEDGTEGELQPIPEDSEDEWNMIEEVFNSFMEE